MIQRVRARLFGLALLISLVAGVAAAAARRSQALGDVLPIAAAAFAIAIGTGLAVTQMLRGVLIGVVKRTRDVVRDPARRISSDGASSDEIRELAE